MFSVARSETVSLMAAFIISYLWIQTFRKPCILTGMTYQHLQHISGVRIDLDDLLIQSRDLKRTAGVSQVEP